jgi:hypothetical protein
LKYDNGGEYTFGHFIKICEDHGIFRQYIVSYTFEQNGALKRKNRTFVEVARSVLATTKLPHTFWVEAIVTTCYIQNCWYTSLILNKTPFEVCIGMQPDLRHLCVFGCFAYEHVLDEKR